MEYFKSPPAVSVAKSSGWGLFSILLFLKLHSYRLVCSISFAVIGPYSDFVGKVRFLVAHLEGGFFSNLCHL